MPQLPVAPAELVDSGAGLVPEGEGWFVLNIADAPAAFTERFGGGVLFEPGINALFKEFGINVRVLQPGEPNAVYHREDSEEAFLVLDGACTAIIENQEKSLKKGDFVYSPPGTAHVFVGAGDGPCTVLMVGGRSGTEVYFPASATADKYGASVEENTDDRGIAYGDAWANMELKKIDVPW
jgi:uncharacterized cupin superfamily protein